MNILHKSFWCMLYHRDFKYSDHEGYFVCVYVFTLVCACTCVVITTGRIVLRICKDETLIRGSSLQALAFSPSLSLSCLQTFLSFQAKVDALRSPKIPSESTALTSAAQILYNGPEARTNTHTDPTPSIASVSVCLHFVRRRINACNVHHECVMVF